MKNLLSKTAIVAAILAAPVTLTVSELPTAIEEYKNDPRLASLRKFFQDGRCPAQTLAAEFLKVADQHNLDWRLLPSISLVESGGGREARNNNLFGWDGGRAMYISFRAGLYDVGGKLSKSKRYRDKDVDEILRIYNPNAGYPGVVKSVMRRISPTEEL
jgi:hypothetical protein